MYPTTDPSPVKTTQLGQRAISDEIVKLVNLRGLLLVENKLERLPGSIVHLTELVALYIGSNPLRSVPNEVLSLTELRA